MAGMYTVEMLAIRYGEPSHEVRRALMDSGVSVDLNDQVDAEAADKKEKDVRKFLDDHNKARLEAKTAGANAGEEKQKWLDAHNKKVEAAMKDGWEAAVAAGGSSSSSNQEGE